MVSINPQYLDVDFEAEPNSCGALMRSAPPGADPTLPIFEETQPLIPESEWKELVAEHFPMTGLPHLVKNQKNEGTCTANAQSQKYDSLFYRQFGEEIETSPVSLYRQVAPGPNTGSGLMEILQAFRTTGILPTDTQKNRDTCNRLGIPAKHFHPNVGYSVRPQSGWKETAKLFRIDEWHDVTSFEGVISALLNHYLTTYARVGHCILAVVPVYENGQYYLKYINSWGDWGDEGYGYDSRSKVEAGIRRYGAIAGRSVLVPKGMYANAT